MAALRRMDAPSYGGDWQAESYGYPPAYGGGQTLPPPASGGGGSMGGGGGGGGGGDGRGKGAGDRGEEGREQKVGGGWALWGEVRARSCLAVDLEAQIQRASPKAVQK